MGELATQISRNVFQTKRTARAMVNYGRSVPGTVKKKKKANHAKAQEFKNNNKRTHCTQV